MVVAVEVAAVVVMVAVVVAAMVDVAVVIVDEPTSYTWHPYSHPFTLSGSFPFSASGITQVLHKL